MSRIRNNNEIQNLRGGLKQMTKLRTQLEDILKVDRVYVWGAPLDCVYRDNIVNNIKLSLVNFICTFLKTTERNK